MLLTALHDYAKERRLLDDLPLQSRTLHALVSIDLEGKLQQDYLTPLSQPDAKGKDRSGMDFLLPRFPGENNGGKAYFLAEGSAAIFGRDKKSGEMIAAPTESGKGNNATKAFQHFWSQIESAFTATGDVRLGALLSYKKRYLVEVDGKILCQLTLLRLRPKDKGKKAGELEFVANTGTSDNDHIAIEKATFGFRIDGVPLSLKVENDPLREYWFSQFARQAFADDREELSEADDSSCESLCLVTGDVGCPIARSHKPKILGVPGIAAGGYIVSFAKAAPAFSSYGFKMGENSPVSESAAAGYALAMMELLRNEETHINLGPISVCVWAKHSQNFGGQMLRSLGQAFPSEVAKFLKTPFSGNSEREIISRDRLYTVALTGNAGRVVIVHWLEQPVEKAVEHFRHWWDDLRIAPMFVDTDSSNEKKSTKGESNNLPPSPFAIPNLARATLRESKKQNTDKLVGERIVQLYRATLEGTAPSLMLLKPILDEFHSALVKDDAKKPTFPFSQSRFALIKLVLLRFFRSQPNRKEGDFMPEPRLAETPDPAYNLGRLLAVFESLQDRYHNFEKKGAGVVERYYGTASSAPAAVFPLLCRLARHHLSKVRKEDESAARRFDDQIGNILKQFQPDPAKPGSSPHFKRMLTLPEQGVFALGFYQQRAYDRAAASVLSNLAKARELRKADKPFAELLTKARDLANEFAYADLIIAVEDFDSQQ